MIELHKGNCLELMNKIPDKSINAIITDPPYGTTACKWDSIIPLEQMWEQLNRIIKPNGAIVLFGSEPFSSALRMSNIKNFRYDWVWQKDQASNFFFLKKQAGKVHELISVFYKKQPTYNPQMFNVENAQVSGSENHSIKSHDLGNVKKSTRVGSKTRYPISVLRFTKVKKSIHPTQKPVALMEYLIKTYTNENETVLDFTMGSGTTMVACQNTNRNGIGIEMEETYFKIAEKRIKENEFKLF